MQLHSKKVKILHLEDERADALLTERMLRKKGLDFEIVVVDGEENYTRAVKEYKPEIVISDHSLPSFNSIDALKILKSIEPNTPFILLTGAVSSEIAVEMLKNGANDFILKDRPERLTLAIKNALTSAKLEKEKRDSEYQFRKLIESSEDVFCLVTREGKIKYISPSAVKLIGYQKDNEEEYLYDIINTVKPGKILDALKKCSRTKPNATLKRIFRISGPNTKVNWLQANFTNLLEDPIINGIRVRLRDITKEKEDEIKIVQSEKKYRSFFNNNLDGILLTAVNGEIFAANPAACDIFQMTEEEICERGRKGLVDPTDPGLYEALEKRKTSGKVTAEIRMKRKDGSIFHAELSSSVFLTSDSKIPKTSMTIRDITQKKRFQEELQITKERYKTIFQLNPLPVFLFDENSLEILDVNQLSCNNYGYTREEFLGMNLKDLRPASEVKKLMEIIRENKSKEEQLLYASVKHLKKNGEIINVEVNSHRLTINNTTCILAVCKDVTLEKKNFLQLQETTKKLKLAEKIAKLGYWEYIEDSNTVFCSNAVYDIFDIEKSSGLPLLDLFGQKVHPEDREKYDEEFKNALEGKANYDLEYRIVLADNKIRWVQAKGKLTRSTNQKKPVLKGVLQDITEQKKSVQKLSISEARYKGFVQSQTSYFVRIGIDGNYTFCNDMFIEDYGWMFPENNPVGQSSLIDVVSYHHEKLMSFGKKCVENPNKNFQVEVHKRLKSGKIRPTIWDMMFLDASGKDGELQCTGIDISEKIKAEERNKFQADLLNKIGQGIMALDSQGKATYWNKAAEKMYGWKKNEVLGEELLPLLYPDFDLYDKEVLKLLKQGEVWNGELQATRKDSSTFPIQITESPLSDTENEFSGSVIISSDITDLKKSELKLKNLNNNLQKYTAELVNANKGLEQFSYIVSHNLRAPVANILGLAEIIKQEERPKEMETLLCNEITNNVSRLDSVIKDLNDILQLNSEVSRKKEIVDIKKLIEDICTSNNHLIDNNNAKIHLDCEEVNEFRSVKSYLYSIFFNLISNSIKYKKPDTPPIIEIKTAKNEKGILITIRDNCLGMDLSKKQDQIFGLYKRFHDHVDGKGMGLFMVKTQMQIIGGDISVESEPNKGTTFQLFFQLNK